MKENLVKEYLLPTRIVEQSNTVQNANALLENRCQQISMKENNRLRCDGTGYIILDFGKEIHGGVRILSHFFQAQKSTIKARIRFGESIGEVCAELGEKNATNDHAVRDMVVEIPDLSDMEWGQTGFRFVRLDFLTENKVYMLVNVYAVYVHRDLQYKGQFACDDELINQIYETARHTLFLNMQSQLWDGIKRDRLVWIGDMQPEVLGITDLFGEDPCVERAIQHSIDKNPLPCWFGDIPTYSFWLIQILYDYYMKVKNADFVEKQLAYIEGVLKQLDVCVTEDGEIDYTLFACPARDGYFLDWPTKGTKDAKAGNRFMFIYTINNLKKLYSELGKENPLCDKLLIKLQKTIERDATAKQVVAFGGLSGMLDKDHVAKTLTDGGAKGLSTYMSYFIFKALSASAGISTALEIMKEYYGGMLSRGATSFWEDFDIDWLKNSGRIDERTPEGLLDLHGDFGKYCYVGFRHSLCHGWSCGPIQFLVEDVLGVQVLDAGCKRIKITPNLGKLQWCKGTFPTPYGNVNIFHELVDGRVKTTFSAPEEVQVVVD